MRIPVWRVTRLTRLATGRRLLTMTACAVEARPRSALVSVRAVAHTTQRRFSSHSAATPAAAHRWIKKIHKALEEARDATQETFSPSLTDESYLLLDLGAKGQYSLQVEGEQLLLFSAASGPRYYVYDAENDWWYNKEDGHLLIELLVRELMYSTSVYINL